MYNSSDNIQAVRMQGRRSNAERTEQTRQALITAARSQFVEKGFAATATPDVVSAAGVTRGALYHHFKDKQALLLAVIETEAAEIAVEIDSGAAKAADAFEALRLGARAYFQAIGRAGRVRLMLLDGPAVLGPQEMRRIDLKTGGRELRLGLAAALGESASPVEIEARADLISAMFDRAALARASGENHAVYERVLDQLLVQLAGEGCDEGSA